MAKIQSLIGKIIWNIFSVLILIFIILAKKNLNMKNTVKFGEGKISGYTSVFFGILSFLAVFIFQIS